MAELPCMPSTDSRHFTDLWEGRESHGSADLQFCCWADCSTFPPSRLKAELALALLPSASVSTVTARDRCCQGNGSGLRLKFLPFDCDVGPCVWRMKSRLAHGSSCGKLMVSPKLSQATENLSTLTRISGSEDTFRR